MVQPAGHHPAPTLLLREMERLVLLIKETTVPWNSILTYAMELRTTKGKPDKCRQGRSSFPNSGALLPFVLSWLPRCRFNALRSYEPRFTYHGFRFVEVHGVGYPLGLHDVSQRVVHSDVEALVKDFIPRKPAGEISFPNTKLFDQVLHNVRWTLIDNLHSVPEDCDQRNERYE